MIKVKIGRIEEKHRFKILAYYRNKFKFIKKSYNSKKNMKTIQEESPKKTYLFYRTC